MLMSVVLGPLAQPPRTKSTANPRVLARKVEKVVVSNKPDSV
jgi:hypothetical protein